MRQVEKTRYPLGVSPYQRRWEAGLVVHIRELRERERRAI